MLKAIVFTVIFTMSLLQTGFAKDKSVANDYRIILQVDAKGKVIEVKTENTMPTKLKEKTMEAFLNKEIGKKVIDGKAVPYKQKLVISTKFLVGDSRVSKR